MRRFKPLFRETCALRGILFQTQKNGVEPAFWKQFRTLQTTTNLASSATCAYKNGNVVVTLPLPSRNENCEFTLRPVSHTVKNLVTFVQDEDRGIDRIALYSLEGNKISNSTPIDILMQSDFKVGINDSSYHVEVPQVDILLPSSDDPTSQTKNLISQLYTDMRVQEYKDHRQRQIKEQLENLQVELTPLEESKAVIDAKTAQRTNVFVWAGLGYMALQFGFLARLTWWEYSWDIMEPVTYFVTYAGAMAFYAYFVLTREDSSYPEVRNRFHLLWFHKAANNHKFDVVTYNAKKEAIAKLETEMKLLQTPPSFAELNSQVEQ